MMDNKFQHGVLVVDDEPLVLKYTTSVIAGVGYKNVHKAANGQSARDILLAEEISLIICDVSLPDADGRQLIREALELNPAAGGVLITGYLSGDMTVPAELAGRVRFLEKPFTADDISHVLAELIERRAPAMAVGRA